MNKRGQYRRNNTGTIWFVVHLIVGLYFINLGFNFIPLTFISDSIKNYITIAGGILIVIAGFMAMRRTPAIPYR